jgi:hypothetical protein
VDRKHLQNLARTRLKDAKALLGRKRWSGAYYLSGYVVECALKACLLNHLGESDAVFGEQGYLKRLADCWAHDLVKSAVVKPRARSSAALRRAAGVSGFFGRPGVPGMGVLLQRVRGDPASNDHIAIPKEARRPVPAAQSGSRVGAVQQLVGVEALGHGPRFWDRSG